MAEGNDDKASGDVGSEPKGEAPSMPPEPPKIPDVELIVDGFGFMPKTKEVKSSKRESTVFDKSQKSVKEMAMPESEEVKSPCASSTNVDIVRRYTWKTKNRMTVQVIAKVIVCRL